MNAVLSPSFQTSAEIEELIPRTPYSVAIYLQKHLLLSLRFRTKNICCCRFAFAQKNICCCRFAFAQKTSVAVASLSHKKHLLLSLRFRTKKHLHALAQSRSWTQLCRCTIDHYYNGLLTILY